MINTIKTKNSRLSSLLSSHSFNLYQSSTAGRRQVEQTVNRIFNTVYNANILDFLPLLVTAETNNQINAVIGLRRAEQSFLFLENYLNKPIEVEAMQRHQLSIDRSKMVEIGNLVSTKSGTSQQLFIVLAFALAEVGIDWVSFTATEQVDLLLNKLGFKPIEICSAEQELVANSDSVWGSYYAHHPKINVGNVKQAVITLKNTPIIKNMYPTLQPLIMHLAEQLKLGLSI